MCPKTLQPQPTPATRASAAPWPRTSAEIGLDSGGGGWVESFKGHVPGQMSVCAGLGQHVCSDIGSVGVSYTTTNIHDSTRPLSVGNQRFRRYNTSVSWCSPYVAIGCTLIKRSFHHGPHWHPAGHEEDSFWVDVGEVCWSQSLHLTIFETRFGGTAYNRKLSAAIRIRVLCVLSSNTRCSKHRLLKDGK